MKTDNGVEQGKVSEAVRLATDLFRNLGLNYYEMEAAADALARAAREVMQAEDLGIRLPPK